jgi:hypothetical protein
MTGKTINELPEITTITSDAAFVVELSGTTYQIKTPNISSGNLFGSFYSTVTQGISGSVDDAYPMSAETVAYSVGIDVVDGSKFTVQSGGTYNLQFSSQFNKLSGFTGAIISIWMRKNGEDIDASRGDVYAGSNLFDAKVLPSWNYIETLEAGDNLELMWCSTSNLTILEALDAETAPLPFKPSLPSVAVTLTQI